ncbi:MAG: hypothetical protein A2909_00975 [Candidatus Tagabacteria bacterium RIFCSPLOWO2_01_FULL_39_11]|uniref:Type 4 fimbrial biogenesis protein PilX N-terminal domain-containing protein n=1 Tax=Candidatus Tagabacteria bacterium RIFCSPLOWO2_01_FULL_39_11 TaxID=1802295 RepID=A0A1G2LQM7_9BACT|nr:MAG: hypothetical protein A2909_00975 [Candidatus Tagabacteria bacterium RIFCSPLOWO2_01_FULL_39_11]
MKVASYKFTPSGNEVSFSGLQTNKGQAVMTVVIFFLFISIAIVFGLAGPVIGEVKNAKDLIISKKSYFLAEAGEEDAAYRVIRGMNYSSTEEIILDGFSATTVISSIGGDEKEIISNANVSDSIRKINIVLKTGVGVGFNYGAQIGYLGLEMENNSRVNGSIYSNGSVEGSSNSVVAGDVWVAGGTASTSDQQQIDQTLGFNVRDIDNRKDAAQSFIPSITAEPRKASLYIKKVGNPGNPVIRVLPDDNGVPKSSGAIASGQLDKDDVTSAFGWVDISFNSTDPITQGLAYWLIIDNDSSDSSKYYILGGDGDSSYLNGNLLYTRSWQSDSAVWASSSPPGDITFKIFLGDHNTVIDSMNVGESGVGNAHANTIIDSVIAGNAYYQNISNTTIGGTANQVDTDPPPLNPPLSQANLDQFKADGDSGGTCGIFDGCDTDGNFILINQEIATSGPKQITGLFRLENQSKFIMTGNIHINGDAHFKNNCVVRLNPSSYGEKSGVIIVDGNIDIDNRCQFLGSGDPNSYIAIISTSPNITSPPAIRVNNSTMGAIFYAAEGSITVENNAEVKEIFGHKVKMENNSVINYESGLANVNFSVGPEGGWSIESWREIE